MMDHEPPSPRLELLEHTSPAASLSRPRARRAALIGTVGGAAALLCVGLAGWQPGHEEIGLPTADLTQAWSAWGVCSHLGKDVAYLYKSMPKNKLERIPSAEQCCTYCQSMSVCRSWTWIQSRGDCYLEDRAPVRNVTKKGYWAGLSSPQANMPAGEPASATTRSTTAAAAHRRIPLAALLPSATTVPPTPKPAPLPAPMPTTTAPVIAPLPVPLPVPAPVIVPVAAPASAPATAAAVVVSPASPSPLPAVQTVPGGLSGGAPVIAPAPAVIAPVPAPAMTPAATPAAAPVSPASGAGGKAITGGSASRDAFEGFLKLWRDSYQANDGSVPDLADSVLPAAFHGIPTKIVVSSGGAAGGVVTEGMGYGIMVEAFKAVAGDRSGLSNGLALLRGWQGMVYGPKATHHPFGGGTEKGGSTDVLSYPYGVSAIPGAGGGTPSGVAGWKFPVDQCYPKCQGSATDGDEDAVLGMVYLAAALDYPDDFVDMVMRAVIAFASADLGFPDLYRSLPDGTKVFIPKGGSQWGGLLPEQGKYKSSQEAWCYNPSYFAPGHYRSFRDFIRKHWQPAFDSYLPPHLDGTRSTMQELVESYDGAVTGGYNVLYYSSCSSGSVGNWVGVKAECPDGEGLSCAGVPWATTPYVGEQGTCTASGTTFGSYGPDACRTPWRIAMDYILHTEESVRVPMYSRTGQADTSLQFNAQVYLNRMANQYKNNAKCDGAKGTCKAAGSSTTATFKLSVAFDQGPDMTCDYVPNAAQSWWAAFMAWPTFTSFVAPLESLSPQDSAAWLDTFANNCQFGGSTPTGNICASSYFELGQEVISTMVMAGAVVPLPDKGVPAGAPLVYK